MIPRLRYTLAEAAEALGISRSMIDVVIRENGLVVHSDTPGGHRYISLESLQYYIREQEEKPIFGRRIQVQKR